MVVPFFPTARASLPHVSRSVGLHALLSLRVTVELPGATPRYFAHQRSPETACGAASAIFKFQDEVKRAGSVRSALIHYHMPALLYPSIFFPNLVYVFSCLECDRQPTPSD